MDVESLVGRQGPCSGSPDDSKGRLSLAGQFFQIKGLGQCRLVGGFKGHIQGIALFVGVFNFKFGQ